jgi:predicted MFS family arabinose efflux permease
MQAWPLLRNRDYMLLWSGETLSQFGSQTSTVAYPLLVLGVTGSAAKAGVVGLARWLPLAVFALPAGALADRLNRKRLMIACAAIRMLGAASIVVALWLGQASYPQIVAVAFLDGALFIVSEICERGALRQIVPAPQLQDAVAQNEARAYTAGIVGPSLGGVLFGVARALPFLADAASFLGSISAISLTRAPFGALPYDQPGKSRLRSDLFDGFAWLRRQPFFWTASRLFALGNPAFLGLNLLGILLAKHNHASSAAVGAMLAIAGAGGLVGATIAGPVRRRLRGRALIAGGEWVFAAAVLMLLVAHDPLLIGLLMAVAELPAPVTNSQVSGSRVALTPAYLQGRVAAVAVVISMSLSWLGPLAVGIAFEHTGATATTLLLAGWVIVLAVSASLAPGLRHEPVSQATAQPGQGAGQGGRSEAGGSSPASPGKSRTGDSPLRSA